MFPCGVCVDDGTCVQIGNMAPPHDRPFSRLFDELSGKMSFRSLKSFRSSARPAAACLRAAT